MDQRVNVMTLGVEKIDRSKKFYTDLGFKPSSVSQEGFVVFQMQGILLFLYPKEALAEDVGVSTQQDGFSGITLAHNVSSKELVQPILLQAQKAGAKILKNAEDVFWGGHRGYFSDPDGHVWEVAWNPHWPLAADGTILLPG